MTTQARLAFALVTLCVSIGSPASAAPISYSLSGSLTTMGSGEQVQLSGVLTIDDSPTVTGTAAWESDYTILGYTVQTPTLDFSGNTGQFTVRFIIIEGVIVEVPAISYFNLYDGSGHGLVSWDGPTLYTHSSIPETTEFLFSPGDRFYLAGPHFISDSYSSYTEYYGTIYGERIPEPATLLLLGTGLVGFVGRARRRSHR